MGIIDEKYEVNNDILDNLKIKTSEETVEELVKNKKSIARFGDGEFLLIEGKDIKFQKSSIDLSKRLNDVLNSNEKSLLIGIHKILKKENMHLYVESSQKYWESLIERKKDFLTQLLNKDKQFYDSSFTRFYMGYKDKSKVKEYVEKLKQIWEKQQVCIVEGEFSRLGAENNIFDKASSVERIICPAQNAFEKYDIILNTCKKIKKYKLILLSLGPTATILAYDLCKLGYWVIDIGHIDLEYEWFLMNATERVKIDTKYVAEVNNGDSKIKDIKNKKYADSIIFDISKL